MMGKKNICIILALLIILLHPVLSTTKFYGQVIYNDRPAQNIIVYAIWKDSRGEDVSARYTTLSIDDAANKGFPYLYGYYYFESDAAPGTSISLSVEGANGEVRIIANDNIKPQLVKPIIINEKRNIISQIVYDAKIYVAGRDDVIKDEFHLASKSYDFYTEETEKLSAKESEDSKRNIEYAETPETKDEEKDSVAESNKIPEKNITTPLLAEAYQEVEIQSSNYDEGEKSLMKLLKIFFGVILFLLGLGLTYIIYIYVFKKLIKNFSGLSLNPLVNKKRRIFNSRINKISKQTLFHQGEKSILEMLTRHTDTLIVSRENKLVGEIHARDFLTDPSKENVIPAEISIQRNSSVQQAFTIFNEKKITKIAVMYNDVLVGELDIFDLLNTVRSFSKNYKEGHESGLKLVRHIMDKDLIKVKHTDKVSTVRKIMDEKNIEYVAIEKDDKVIGIFTIFDYLSAINRFVKESDNQVITNVMSERISLNPEYNIFEANDHMLSRKSHYFQVMQDGKILGILSTKNLLGVIFKYLSDEL